MSPDFAEALCLDPDSVLIAEAGGAPRDAIARAARIGRLRGRLALLTGDQLGAVERIVDAILVAEVGHG